MVRYISPVNPGVYPHLAITLLGIGLFFMAWFFVYPTDSLLNMLPKAVCTCMAHSGVVTLIYAVLPCS